MFPADPFHHERNRSSKRELALDYFTGYRIRGPRLRRPGSGLDTRASMPPRGGVVLVSSTLTRSESGCLEEERCGAGETTSWAQ